MSIVITLTILYAALLYGMVYAVGQKKNRELEDAEQEAYLLRVRNK